MLDSVNSEILESELRCDSERSRKGGFQEVEKKGAGVCLHCGFDAKTALSFRCDQTK